MQWLPPGKGAAIVFSVDDVHPAAVALDALAHVRRLQERHPRLKATLFTTPDWRSCVVFPRPSLVDRIPLLRDAVYRVPRLPRGTYLLDRHPAFVDAVRGWKGIEVAPHGLTHVGRGPQPTMEFRGVSRSRCRVMLRQSLSMFESAKLPIVRGISPPGWLATPALLAAMRDLDFRFVASARDLQTPPAAGAMTNGSGLRGVSLIRPQLVGDGIVHFTTNYQATSSAERAFAIADAGGLISVKAHLLTGLGAHKSLDGLCDAYRDQLDALFIELEERYGDALWWTSMSEIAARMTTP
jgi:hypothetical protein